MEGQGEAEEVAFLSPPPPASCKATRFYVFCVGVALLTRSLWRQKGNKSRGNRMPSDRYRLSPDARLPRGTVTAEPAVAQDVAWGSCGRFQPLMQLHLLPPSGRWLTRLHRQRAQWRLCDPGPAHSSGDSALWGRLPSRQGRPPLDVPCPLLL